MSDQINKAFSFAPLDKYTFAQRMTIRLAAWAFYWSIRIIGSTVRFDSEGLENFDNIRASGKLPVYAFWHDRIIGSAYYFRHRKIVVLTSQSYDSEYTSRCIQRLGFGVVRGSSTRGGVQALVGMIRLMREGFEMAFTVDGPKGPRYEAKPGPVLLAKKSGNPMAPFLVEFEKSWKLKSWDKLQIPKPFTKGLVMASEPIPVPSDLDDVQLEEKQLELQKALDKLVARGEEWRLKQR
ncbi:MAG: lysophospholipid acyltransferase family protein [Acidobacteria bacterium]|nr:lysophospholipid acyltransferase family protein [Acidobacteriota bacterium]